MNESMNMDESPNKEVSGAWGSSSYGQGSNDSNMTTEEILELMLGPKQVRIILTAAYVIGNFWNFVAQLLNGNKYQAPNAQRMIIS